MFCKYCDKQISASATYCEHCGAQLRQNERSSPKIDWIRITVYTLGGLFLLGVVSSALDFNRRELQRSDSDLSRNSTSIASSESLALTSSQGYISSSYLIVEGEVENTSNHPLDDVVAVVSCYDKNGQFINSDDALIEYKPILVGQRSPFKVMVNNNPLMRTYAIEFKKFNGGTIPYQDFRNSKRKK